MDDGEHKMDLHDLRNFSEVALLVLIAGKIIDFGGALKKIKSDILEAVFNESEDTLSQLSELKSEVDMFLQPQIRFYVRDVLQRRLKMKDTEKVTAVIELDDAKGFPTGQAFDQAPLWSIDDESIATLAPSEDGLSCDVIGQKPGNALLSVAGVAGGVSYAGSIPVPVIAGDATQIKVSLGAPVAQ